jgi:cathepsin B
MAQKWGMGTLLARSEKYATQFAKLKVDNSYAVNLRGPDLLKLPDNMLGSEVWKDFLPPIRNQGLCGSCWAFSTSTCLSTRIAIYTKNKIKPLLSVGEMVSCNLGVDTEMESAIKYLKMGLPYDYALPQEIQAVSQFQIEHTANLGCSGETLIAAWQYLYRMGVPEEKCIPYSAITGLLTKAKYNLANFSDRVPNAVPSCTDTMGPGFDQCSDGSPAKHYHVSGYYIVPGVPSQAKDAGEYDVRKELWKFGPVSTGFMVHTDFQKWDGKTGVYRWDGKSPEIGGHAVVICGWGIENGIPFWECLNSWGTEWGRNGFFRIARGTNECQIEENIMVGIPELPGMRMYIDWPIYYALDDYTMRNIWKILHTGYKVTLYEKLLAGSISISPDIIKTLNDTLYPMDTWPDFSKLIAAQPNTVSFPLEKYIPPSSSSSSSSSATSILKSPTFKITAGVSLSTFILGIVVMWIFYTLVLKKRKQN